MPMKQQYEQQCNAAALAKMGVPIIKNLKDKNLALLDEWLYQGRPVPVHYPDQTAAILDQLLHQRPAAVSSQATPA
jgi:hypothetical protein